MSATLSDCELLQQLRDALVRSNNALNVLTATNHQHDAEIIAAADARLSQPEAALSHEVWDAICEQSSGWMNQSGKGLMITENDLITIGEQFAYPAAATELSQSDIDAAIAASKPSGGEWWLRNILHSNSLVALVYQRRTKIAKASQPSTCAQPKSTRKWKSCGHCIGPARKMMTRSQRFTR